VWGLRNFLRRVLSSGKVSSSLEVKVDLGALLGPHTLRSGLTTSTHKGDGRWVNA
jgi:hypothetical protein